ncbi:unnamed protein product [Somion occarium]|uniref:Uncharacterized protein n=1 Tax=Somion occarium TaxID=3059160 RepID=A0ABP1CIM8_9APHY
MAPPPIQLFLTTIASQPALRQRQEYLLRVLQVKKIPFTSYDLASDEDAKKLWRRKAPLDKLQLPGLLVGGRFLGTFSDFEEAVECGELEVFLRRNESYDEDEDAKPTPPAKPVGVPGAYSPSQMHPKYHPSPSPSPSPLKGKSKEDKSNLINAGEHLSEFGLHDVEVSIDDLTALVEELGLGSDDAKDLVKGLGTDSKTTNTKDKEESAKAPTPDTSAQAKETVKSEPELKSADTNKSETGPKDKANNEAESTDTTQEGRTEKKDAEKVVEKETEEAKEEMAETPSA